MLQIELDDVGVEESDEVAAETESLATTSQIRFTDEQFEAVGGNKIKFQYSTIGGIKEALLVILGNGTPFYIFSSWNEFELCNLSEVADVHGSSQENGKSVNNLLKHLLARTA